MCGGNGRGWEGKREGLQTFWQLLDFAFLLKIFFITVLDLQKKITEIVQRVPTSPNPASPIKKSYISTIHLLQLENQHDE